MARKEEIHQDRTSDGIFPTTKIYIYKLFFIIPPR